MAEETAIARIPVELPSTTQQSSQLTRLAAFTPTNLTEAMALAKLIASSDLAPKDYRNKPGNVLIGIQYAAELGIAPLTGLQNISIINGRAAVWGDLALALVQAHPDYEGHKEFWQGSGDSRTAVMQIKRRNQEWHQQTFSVNDAKTAGLWGKLGPWKTNPDRMLQMRARGFGLRDKFADALKGLRLAEEAMDIPPEKPTRETGTLDVNREIATMTASSEPNRGHGNEGLVQQPALAKAEDVNQSPKKQEDAICSECRQTNGHKSDCIHAQPPCSECHAPAGKPHATKCSRKDADAAPTASSEPQKEAEGTSPIPAGEIVLKEGQEKMLLKVLKVEPWTKGNLSKLNLTVEDNDMNEWELSCWHKSLVEPLKTAVGQLCAFVVEKKEKNGREFYNLESILAIGATEYGK